MCIAYAALHRTMRYRGEDTKLFVMALFEEQMFFARRQPDFYDRRARLIPPREVLPGSYVNISFVKREGVNWMTAVQLVEEPAQDSPFDPVPDDGQP
jgi:hypothetical protein